MIILAASALVRESEGLKISLEFTSCQLVIHSSFALFAYGIIQLVSISENTFVELADTVTSNSLNIIAKASHLDTLSFGLKTFLLFISSHLIQYSFAFSTYLIVHVISQRSVNSVKSVESIESSTVIQNDFIVIARNSALVISLFGLNDQSVYHFRIHLEARAMMSFLAKLSQVSLNL